MERQTQTEQIKMHLQTGGSITQLEALNLYGCMRLGARILELKRSGMPIFSRTVKHNGKYFSQYAAQPFN